MAAPAERVRESSGKFSTKRKISWKQNLVIAAKRRKIQREEEAVPVIVEGRRIVEIDKLAAEMWCSGCQVPLSFRYVQEEIREGLASLFLIQCHICLAIHKVHTCKWSKDKETSKRKYNVNLKGALATLDGGIGVTHLNTILSELNIPVVYNAFFKRYERQIGKVIEETAKESCREALKLEKSLTQEAERSTSFEVQNGIESSTNSHCVEQLQDQVEQKHPTNIKISYDTGWQKKGSGRSYNSLTGHAIAIGSKSRKVLAYATRNKRCVRCERGYKRDDHDCRVNHTGSSKSMESSMAVEIITKNAMLQEENVQISTIIGDDDSTTIANVRREANHPVEKESDINHATCTLSKDMWSLKIPAKIIDYMKYCFGCVLHRNKGNVENVRAGLLNIVPHAFDDHSKCGTWCGYSANPTTYKHKILPRGKGLTDINMKASLSTIFQKFASHAEKLAPCGSTQGNESFHHQAASKAPKSIHYGGSESNDFRIASAVCQKNFGTSYVLTVHEKLNISPGKFTADYRAKKDHYRETQAAAAKCSVSKARRRFLFQARRNKNVNAESREGITYSSGCGFNTVDVDTPTSTPHEVIPEDSVIIYFDLETTGLNSISEIVQISAKRGPEEFNEYMLPTREISRAASLVTGLAIDNGELVLHGQQLVTIPRRVAMQRFIEFLKPGPAILVAHNGQRFDTPMILKELHSLDLMCQFQTVVCGFCDSLPVLRNKLPERVAAKKSFRLSNLSGELVGEDASLGAHNGIIDVRMLEKIIQIVGITDEELRKNAVSFQSTLTTAAQAAQTKLNRNSFDCIKQGVSAGMITKLAKAGLTVDHLKKSFSDGGEVAVTILLASDVNGRPRVTKNKKVCQTIVTEIKKCMEKP